MSPSFTGGASPTVPSFFSMRRKTPRNLVRSAAIHTDQKRSKSPPARQVVAGSPFNIFQAELGRPLLTFDQDLATGLAPVDNGGIGDAPNMVNGWMLKGLRLFLFLESQSVQDSPRFPELF